MNLLELPDGVVHEIITHEMPIATVFAAGPEG
jgi:hypothetical protein